MLYYEYWSCCRPKVAGILIPVYINLFALTLVGAAIYALCYHQDCYQVSGRGVRERSSGVLTLEHLAGDSAPGQSQLRPQGSRHRRPRLAPPGGT